jgi:formate--tetrahydrofolate ligase
LKERLSRIVVAYSFHGEPITVAHLNVAGSLTALLKDAFNPNLVQTLEGTPALIHGGPFANIAHGCNSLIATKLAQKLGDFTVTEAGFGADLGAEKFLDIKCRAGNMCPDAVVLVATARALKYNGGIPKGELQKENLDALKNGSQNLLRHIHNIKDVFGLNVLVAINRFATDTDEEIALLKEQVQQVGVSAYVSTGHKDKSTGSLDLASALVDLVEKNTHAEKKDADIRQGNTKTVNFVYDISETVEDKARKLVQKIYGGKAVQFSPKAKSQIVALQKNGFDKLPICIAKTQYSFSDNPLLLGAPSDFTVQVQEVQVSRGAGFIVLIAGNIMRMPGLPKVPAANQIDIDANGNIVGLF